MRFHYFQHVPFEGLGYTEQWLNDRQYKVSATRFYKNDYQIPDVHNIDALIIMGGPMGVYDDDQYPWLAEEKSFIKTCIQNGKKVLGICLGAQLISACLGGVVRPAKNREIGWFPVAATTACQANVPWFYELLKDEPILFHWHGDQFSIPLEACDLALTIGNDNQAFLYKDNVLGLQFHLECTPQSLQGMLDHFNDHDDRYDYVQAPKEIIKHFHYCTAMNRLMDQMLNQVFEDK